MRFVNYPLNLTKHLVETDLGFSGPGFTIAAGGNATTSAMDSEAFRNMAIYAKFTCPGGSGGNLVIQPQVQMGDGSTWMSLGNISNVPLAAGSHQLGIYQGQVPGDINGDYDGAGLAFTERMPIFPSRNLRLYLSNYGNGQTLTFDHFTISLGM